MLKATLYWDLPTRIFHWVIAFGVIADFFLEGGDPPHNIVGYVAAAAVILRLLYGINKKFHREHLLAHIIYILIWTSVVALGVTGYLLGTDEFWGDENLNNIHVQIANALAGLSLAHVLGVIIHAIRFKEKTWMGMITGKRY